MFLSCRQAPHPRSQPQPQPEASPQEPEEEILGSDDEEQEDPNDYCKGEPPVSSSHFTLVDPVVAVPSTQLVISLFCVSRWLSPCENRRPLQWEIPCDPETGLGALLHCLAGLGHPVRTIYPSVCLLEAGN